jgi:hypothetical protein
MRAAALRSYRELLQAARVREAPIGAVDESLERVDRILREAGVPFAVIGGFAVIEHGYERFTKDIDVLLYAADLKRAIEALRAAGIVGRRTPIGAKLVDEATGVTVDLLGSAFDADERALARAQRGRRHLPVIPVAHLVLMKLESGRAKDDADVVELVKAGLSPTVVTPYLRRAWPELLPRFRTLVARARVEVASPRRRPPSRRRRR